MKQKMLQQMKSVAEAQYFMEHARLKPILDAETGIRTQLAKLDRQVQQAREQSEDNLAMKSLGADLLWQGWHNRTRRQLNVELAQATAKKLMAMERLRKTFGRKLAVETMADDVAKQRKADRAARQLAQLLKL